MKFFRNSNAQIEFIWNSKFQLFSLKDWVFLETFKLSFSVWIFQHLEVKFVSCSWPWKNSMEFSQIQLLGLNLFETQKFFFLVWKFLNTRKLSLNIFDIQKLGLNLFATQNFSFSLWKFLDTQKLSQFEYFWK